MSTRRPGRHELGQNFLVHRPTIERVVSAVAATRGPIVEIGAGRGALTLPLADLDRPLTAVEVDARTAAALRRRVPAHVVVEVADALDRPHDRRPHVVVGNLPFHLTTALLRHVLAAPAWTDAVLLVQWEVARRRAGVGGATLMTVQWWPWYSFALLGRVPARAFRPAPAVDGGILIVGRRPEALVVDRTGYQRFAKQVFTGRGRGLAEVVARVVPGVRARQAEGWLRQLGVADRARPKDLTADQWVGLWRLRCEQVGRSRS